MIVIIILTFIIVNNQIDHQKMFSDYPPPPPKFVAQPVPLLHLECYQSQLCNLSESRQLIGGCFT